MRAPRRPPWRGWPGRTIAQRMWSCLPPKHSNLWATAAVTYHFKGLCLWPLMSVRLATGQLAEAVEAGCQMLEPAQVRLPDELESFLEAAKAAWDRDEHALAARQLTEALGLASQLGYA